MALENACICGDCRASGCDPDCDVCARAEGFSICDHAEHDPFNRNVEGPTFPQTDTSAKPATIHVCGQCLAHDAGHWGKDAGQSIEQALETLATTMGGTAPSEELKAIVSGYFK